MRRAFSEAGAAGGHKKAHRKKKKQIPEGENEQGEDEYVFALRHDFGYTTIKPTHRRGRKHHKLRTS